MGLREQDSVARGQALELTHLTPEPGLAPSVSRDSTQQLKKRFWLRGESCLASNCDPLGGTRYLWEIRVSGAVGRYRSDQDSITMTWRGHSLPHFV